MSYQPRSTNPYIIEKKLNECVGGGGLDPSILEEIEAEISVLGSENATMAQDIIDIKGSLNSISDNLVKLSPTTQITSTSIKNSDYTNVTISTAGLYSIKVKNNNGVTATLNVGIQDSNGNRIFELISLDAGSYATLQTPFFYMEAGTYSIRASGGSLGELIKLS